MPRTLARVSDIVGDVSADMLVELRAIRALLEQQVAEQRRTNRLLERLIGARQDRFQRETGHTGSQADPVGHGSEDPADVALAAGLDFLKDGDTFRTQSLIDHGEHFPDFKRLLLAADVQTAADMGYWLRRYRGRVLNGRRLECVDRDSDGAIWCLVTI